MPDELDATTARLVSELAVQMLPSLTKALNNNALERTNRMSQELRSHIEKNLRSSIEDNRAGRSMLMQSIASIVEEFTSLKRQIEKLSDKINNINSTLENAVKNAPVNKDNDNKPPESLNNNILSELADIQEMLSELVKGLQSFSETCTQNNNNNNASNISEKFITNLFANLEGLIKSQGNTHTQEFKELSREMTSSQEQNNIALNHEIKEFINEELANFMSESTNNNKKRPSSLIIKTLAALTFTNIIFMGVIIYLLLR